MIGGNRVTVVVMVMIWVECELYVSGVVVCNNNNNNQIYIAPYCRN